MIAVETLAMISVSSSVNQNSPSGRFDSRYTSAPASDGRCVRLPDVAVMSPVRAAPRRTAMGSTAEPGWGCPHQAAGGPARHGRGAGPGINRLAYDAMLGWQVGYFPRG